MKPTNGNISQGYSANHQALDYAVATGTNVIAVKSGTIVDLPGQPTRKLMGNLSNRQHWGSFQAGKQNSGNVVTVSHGNGEYTCYLHVSPYAVEALRGRQVKQGDVIALSGHNGWSTGAHLHFEVWVGGLRINPQPWLNNIKQEATVTNNDKLALLLNPTYYASQHGDLARNGVKTAAQLRAHWLKHGVKENRRPNPTFSAAQYLANYGDLQRAYGKDYLKANLHYIDRGIREGRHGHKINPVTNAAQVTLDKIKAIIGK